VDVAAGKGRPMAMRTPAKSEQKSARNGHAREAKPTQVNVALLKRLSETPGIAGREERVRAVVIEELKPLVDELSVDALGNVIAIKKGSSEKRVMLAAHMDEIGFIVRYVEKDGWLRLQPLGGFDPR